MQVNKRATIVEVAKQAQVSTATAARVFDPKWADRVRPQTKKKVLAAAQALGYYGGGALVRGMQGRGTNMIALVIGRNSGYLYADVLVKFIHHLQEAGKQVLVFEVDPAEGLDPILKQVYNYRVDAVIVTAAASTNSVVDVFATTDIPVIAFNMLCHGNTIHSLHCDSAQATAAAAAHLLAMGHRTFAVVTGNRNLSRDTARENGFCAYITAHGGQILTLLDADYGYENGKIAGRQLFQHPLPDAVFCTEDTIALGVIDVARHEFGLHVPKDISVMGFDGAPLGKLDGYQLTTMQYPIDAMVSDTVRLLLQVLDCPSHQQTLSYSLSLYEGNTCAPRTK